jgi:dolichyl-phosphate-mannose-protein mannosyltransferase
MKSPRLRLPSSWRPELIALILAAFATRFWDLFFPNAVVFDEVYFKAFAAHYLDHHYYFDIHPPLGKLLLGGFAHVLGLAPAAMISGTALGLRMLPALAGALLVPAMWGILRRLGASRLFAFLGALAILLDNALLVESRFILMDSLLLLSGLGAVYFYLVARDHHDAKRWLWLSLAAVSAGVSVSIKWTGLNALAIIILVWLWDLAVQRSFWKKRPAAWTKRLAELAVLILIPAAIYITTFWIHFSLLPHSGDGDAFMSQRFQSTLIGNPAFNPAARMSFWSKFIELNQEMYRANQTLTATHPYGSHWFSWPLELRPVYYWEGTVATNGGQGNIYLLGNPVIWWGIWVALLSGLALAWSRGRRLRPATIAALAVAGVAYFINLLPFVDITRVMFLYHYFFSFVFSVIFVIMLWNDLATGKTGRQLQESTHRQIFGAVILAIFLGWLYFTPLSYGFPLSPAGLQAHMWLHSWR